MLYQNICKPNSFGDMVFLRRPESIEHKRIKDLISSKLEEWFGASIKEYPSSGHELDVFAVTPDGISIYVEIIWSETRSNFFRDLNMIQQSDADVKLVVVSPKVLNKEEYNRIFSKVVVSQRKIGFKMYGELINGQRILDEPEYLDTKFKETVFSLINQARLRGGFLRSWAEFKPPESPKVDEVPERLFSNIFPVKELPRIIFSSPTQMRTEPEVFKSINNNVEVPPFILKRKRLYTFHDIKSPDSPFLPIISKNNIHEEKVDEWIENNDTRNDLIRLLNLSLRVFLLERHYIKYDKRHRRFICLLKDGRSHYFRWRARERFSSKALAKEVYGKDGQLLYCMHQAASLRFIFIDDKVFLKIEPTVVFTKDGHKPFRYERLASLMSRWIPRQYNESYLNLVRFWAKYLSKLDTVITISAGDQRIVIDTQPAMTKIMVGISKE